jgi:NTP pyrophosphatase (non-canonical NTP hydrolase)
MFTTYQEMTLDTATYPEARERTINALNYCLMALGGEVGEAQNKFKKILRGDHPLGTVEKLSLALELGDALWYIARAADELGYDLHEVAQMNLDKLRKRQVAGVVRGDGDNR